MPTLESDGVVVCEQVLSKTIVASLRADFDAIAGGPGARAFEPSEDIQRLVGERGVMGSLAAALANRPVKSVRILFFDKTPDSNWGVPWHQDRTIAVRQRHEMDGYGPWTSKNGVTHVEPPVTILERMLTLRLFVDDCGPENGPLEVACGSHRCGRVPADEVREIVQRSEIFAATGRSGDVLAMRLLAIHSSKRAKSPAHRRVLHVDYASVELPAPLKWALH